VFSADRPFTPHKAKKMKPLLATVTADQLNHITCVAHAHVRTHCSHGTQIHGVLATDRPPGFVAMRIDGNDDVTFGRLLAVIRPNPVTGLEPFIVRSTHPNSSAPRPENRKQRLAIHQAQTDPFHATAVSARESGDHE
jgi:hypothetical protein